LNSQFCGIITDCETASILSQYFRAIKFKNARDNFAAILESMMLKKPDVIFFDLGNTLAEGTPETAHRLLSARLGLTEKEEKKAGRLLMTFPADSVTALATALEGVLRNHDPAKIRNELSRLWEEQYHSVRQIDGAGELIRTLKGQGFILGLISNTWLPFYEGFCRSCPDISSSFEFILLSFQLGIKKPSQAIFKYCLDLTGKLPSECLLVGDSFELDIDPAAKMGFQTAWVLSRPEREKAAIARMLRKETDAPQLVAADLKDLERIIRTTLS
jgi:HAD superfamily hydrolase (TIGR01549 family)